MAKDTVQPSTDTAATALAVAAELCGTSIYDKNGTLVYGGEEWEEGVRARAKLIGELAREMYVKTANG